MDRLFCAIDTGGLADMRTPAKSLTGVVGGVKLGTTFVVENGLGRVAAVAEAGLPEWLALKLLEIPRDVARAVRAARASGAFLVAVHAPGAAAWAAPGPLRATWPPCGRASAPTSCSSCRVPAPSDPEPTTGRTS